MQVGMQSCEKNLIWVCHDFRFFCLTRAPVVPAWVGEGHNKVVYVAFIACCLSVAVVHVALCTIQLVR